MKRVIRSWGNDKGRGATGVVLGFDHPSIDPEEITRRLGMQPSMAAMAGSPVVNMYGEEVPARHRESRWTLDHYFVPCPRESESDDISSAIGELLTVLERHADFVLRVADDGRVAISIQFNGAAHHGIALPPDLLRRMAALHINFGMEVFPHGLG
jgi:hypothetical protein